MYVLIYNVQSTLFAIRMSSKNKCIEFKCTNLKLNTFKMPNNNNKFFIFKFALLYHLKSLVIVVY